jgi:hypothetical protein
MITAKTNSSQRELTPAGSHIATCYSMVHIGNIEEKFNNETKVQNKVRITWELSNEIRNFDGVDKPLVINKEYTLSMHDKSSLRKDLQSWRGKAFTEIEAKSFDITVLLGKSCMLSIIHEMSADGSRQYAKIANISGVPKGTNIPLLFNEIFEFNYEDKFDLNWLEKQPDFIQHKIKSSKEYNAKMSNIQVVEKEINDLPF